YIRFHIPTFIGSGLSGYNLASSDVDGIFGGSGTTYARDLQWKAFIPVTYAMSGWAANDKHPWNYGTTVMDINRKYLKLKMRLTPYMYTYCNKSFETGVPVVRGMILEYPDDPVTFDRTTQYQFMSGEWMLVAPVYQPAYERDSIYFPEGKWIDYWDGVVYDGSTFLNDYPADLSICPVFIKAGAIIPMYPEMLYDNQFPKDPITYDVYPHGYSSFEMYEDDGISREHRTGAFAKTLIESDGPLFGNSGIITVTVGASEGDYEGKPEERSNRFEVHTHGHPDGVLLDQEALLEYASLEEMENAPDGWFYDPDDRLGIVHVKTQSLPTDIPFKVEISTTTNVKKNEIDKAFLIYPNPTTGLIDVTVQNQSIDEIKIFDLQGKLLNKIRIEYLSDNKVTIDFFSYPDGIYYLEVKSQGKTITKKISLVK
ncbi:MAG: DUF5110 domain-containing protein, partial [Bacteroidales bacterium]|nr:DUF5110 domain-containing protein [Bacteroidales bacterium]